MGEKGKKAFFIGLICKHLYWQSFLQAVPESRMSSAFLLLTSPRLVLHSQLPWQVVGTGHVNKYAGALNTGVRASVSLLKSLRAFYGHCE